jgi:hypothetical protein
VKEKFDRLSSCFSIEEAQKVEDCPYPHLPKGLRISQGKPQGEHNNTNTATIYYCYLN